MYECLFLVVKDFSFLVFILSVLFFSALILSDIIYSYLWQPMVNQKNWKPLKILTLPKMKMPRTPLGVPSPSLRQALGVGWTCRRYRAGRRGVIPLLFAGGPMVRMRQGSKGVRTAAVGCPSFHIPTKNGCLPEGKQPRIIHFSASTPRNCFIKPTVFYLFSKQRDTILRHK